MARIARLSSALGYGRQGELRTKVCFRQRHVLDRDAEGRTYARWCIARSTTDLHRGRGRRQFLGGRPQLEARTVRRQPDARESGRATRRETLQIGRAHV